MLDLETLKYNYSLFSVNFSGSALVTVPQAAGDSSRDDDWGFSETCRDENTMAAMDDDAGPADDSPNNLQTTPNPSRS